MNTGKVRRRLVEERVREFGGGTTAVAAMKLGRRFVGCDHDPQQIAKARARVARTALENAQPVPAAEAEPPQEERRAS
jgi:modification methylase